MKLLRLHTAQKKYWRGHNYRLSEPKSNLPPPSTQVRPTYGKASGTSTKMVVESVDYDKFFAALKTRPEWPTVKAQFDEWAQKLANKGIIPDGVKAEERANTR